MGRRDAVQVTLEFVAEWQRLGAEVTFEPGWESRGNGYGADYEGAVIHHTASASSEARPFPTQGVLRDGRPGLSGPLCNSAGPWCPPDRPCIHVMAAFPANHAGASGGRSMGPLPRTALFNPKVWGHEIDYAGTVAMSPGQYRAALIVAKGIATTLGRSTEWIRAHAETSVTGKWDPGYANGKTIDMDAFRRDAAALQEDDMATPGENWGFTITHGVKDLTGNPQAAEVVLGDVFFHVRQLLVQVAAQTATIDKLVSMVAANPGNDLTEESLRTAIREETEAAMAKTVDVKVTVNDGNAAA